MGQLASCCGRNSDADLLAAIGKTGPAQIGNLGYSTTCYLKCDDKYVYFAGPQPPNFVIASAKDGKFVWKRANGNLHLVLREDGVYGIWPGRLEVRLRHLAGPGCDAHPAQLRHRHRQLDSLFYPRQ